MGLLFWYKNKMGKVHGSMARNGKVRNQAPKVEKMERNHKSIVGRAKKRAQYKNRIINVDPMDKRKRDQTLVQARKRYEHKRDQVIQVKITEHQIHFLMQLRIYQVNQN